MDGMKLFAIYLVVMNVLGVAVMWSDKRRARLHRWRIPEKVLFLAEFQVQIQCGSEREVFAELNMNPLSGNYAASAGTWAGMYLFRHKTKHWYFVVGMPLILVCQAALAIYLVHLYVL